MLEFYKDKVIDKNLALELVKSNHRVVTAMAAAEPKFFYQNLHKRAPDVKGVNIFCANPSAAHECFTNPNFQGHIAINVMFLSDSVRKNVANNVVSYIPQHLSQWSNNILREGEVDVFWGTCTMPDKRGFVNLGMNACYEPIILKNAKKVILEINPNMPTTHGSTQVPISWVDHFFLNESPLKTISRPATTIIDEKIAQYVAELVKDESTIQLGIGGIPNAIGVALSSKKDLGVHTEMINDTIMDLYYAGAITGRKKTIWPGKIVGAFALGSNELYQFIDQNPIVELQPAQVVNDPYRIGNNHRMVSINTAVEIDLTGQVCSESVGHRELSGVGGATDTHIGAQRSNGGRGIIALYSTTKNDTESKIVCELKPGAKVSISRNDIDTVVTEYGIAELKGKSQAVRVKTLISIAHPQFREELTQQAKKCGYI